jgi:hypothetical protein
MIRDTSITHDALHRSVAGSPTKDLPELHGNRLPRRVRALMIVLVTLLGLLVLGACSQGESRETGAESVLPIESREERRTPVHIDSIFPMEEEVRRFREGLSAPSELTGGASSIDALADRFLRGLEAGDAPQLAGLALDRAEFAWFYFPHTIYVDGPYELSPSLVWYQLQNRSARGLTRALHRYEGKQLHDTGIECATAPEEHGPDRIHHGCAVLGELPSGEQVREVLFGSVLERDGQFKFVSFTNEL